MRSWLLHALVAVVLFGGCVAKGKRIMDRENTVEFQERVFSFYTQSAGLIVTFHTKPANYVLPYQSDDFVEQAAKLARAWKSQETVTVRVTSAAEIVSVSP
jgi:hypothetical protein